MAAIRNRTVGFVFQNFKLIQNNTILENVSVPLLYAGMRPAERNRRVLDILHRVGLYDKENLVPNKLSGGQQQRVAIARAIVNRPRFIIADEPTGALDSKTSEDIMALFMELNQEQGTTMIVVTHDQKSLHKRIVSFTFWMAEFKEKRCCRMAYIANILHVSLRSIMKNKRRNILQ